MKLATSPLVFMEKSTFASTAFLARGMVHSGAYGGDYSVTEQLHATDVWRDMTHEYVWKDYNLHS